MSIRFASIATILCTVALAFFPGPARSDPARPSPSPAPSGSNRPMYRIVQPFTEAELHQMRATKAAELHGLIDNKRSACQAGTNGTQCQQATQAMKTHGPQLQAEIDALQKHVDVAKRTRGPVNVTLLSPDPDAGRRGGGHQCNTCRIATHNDGAEDPPPPVGNLADNGNTPAGSSSGSPSGPSIATGAPVAPNNVRGGCFIATAAYGSSQAYEVEVLRRFRDEHLVGTRLGDRLVAAYYAVSPPIAAFIAPRAPLRALVRGGLEPIIFAIRHPESIAAIAIALVAVVFGRRRAQW